MRRIVLLVLAAALVLPLPSAQASVVREPVSFTVENPLEPGVQRTVRGYLYRPASDPGCASSVMLLMHGLSYGYWGWDFPLRPETYSVARALAAAGFPAVAVDELGYGSSDKPNGYTLTVQSYAAMTSQMIAQLRAGTYDGPVAPPSFAKVGLMGHSAGTEISELTAGYFGGVDALVATAYHHFPSQRIVTDFVTGDVVRAGMSDYEYFGGTPEQRAEYMYNLDVAEADVVALDTQMANLTPSGEIWSIGSQPSRQAVELITAPVLLVLAEHDLLFPASFAEDERRLFVSSPDTTVHLVEDAGHSFMLHPNAPDTNAAVAAWLETRLPSC